MGEYVYLQRLALAYVHRRIGDSRRSPSAKSVEILLVGLNDPHFACGEHAKLATP